MIKFKEVQDDLARIKGLTPDSMVEVEEDLADGHYIIRIPVVFRGADFMGPLDFIYDEEHECDEQ